MSRCELDVYIPTNDRAGFSLIDNSAIYSTSFCGLSGNLARSSASVLATKTLKKANVRARVEELNAELLLKIDIDNENIIQELAKIGRWQR